MYRLCMIVNIPLGTGNKLNCFISAREMLSISLPCALVLLLFLFCFVVLLIYTCKYIFLSKKNVYETLPL